MKFNATPISYRSTGLFSALINDYIETKGTAQSFVNYAATKEGYKKAIEQRASFPTNRKVLVEALQNQYTQLEKDIKIAEESPLQLGGRKTQRNMKSIRLTRKKT